MSAIGDITKFIPAQAVQISRVAAELVLTSDVKVTGTHIRNTTNTRAGPIYTFQWRVREIEVTIALTEDLLTQMETDNLLDSKSALAFTNYTIVGLAISGAGDNTSDTYSAALVDFDPTIAPESGVAQARIKLLIAGAAT